MNDTYNYYFHVFRIGGHMQNGKMQYHSAEMRFWRQDPQVLSASLLLEINKLNHEWVMWIQQYLEIYKHWVW